MIDAVRETYRQKAEGAAEAWPMVYHAFEPGVADMDIKSDGTGRPISGANDWPGRERGRACADWPRAPPMSEIRILSAKDVAACLTMDEVIDAVRETYRQKAGERRCNLIGRLMACAHHEQTLGRGIREHLRGEGGGRKRHRHYSHHGHLSAHRCLLGTPRHAFLLSPPAAPGRKPVIAEPSTTLTGSPVSEESTTIMP